MNINSLSSLFHSSTGATRNPLTRGKLVISDDKNAGTDDSVKIALAKNKAKAELRLLEETRKISQGVDGRSDSNKITPSNNNDDEAVAPRQNLDTVELSGIMMIDNQYVAERFSDYSGSGDATTSLEIDEAFADKENWLFAFGRNIDREAAGINAQHGMSSGQAADNGYGMRVRYDTASGGDNPVMVVEAIDGTGNKTAYRVDLREVDAANASLVESFALISHLYMGQGKTKEEFQGFDALRLMNNIIDQPKYDPSKAEGVRHGKSGYSVTTPTKSGITTTNGLPGFEDRFNLLSFGQKPVYERPKDGSFLGKVLYL